MNNFKHKMDKRGEKWRGLFYEKNISSQATVEERLGSGEKTLESFISTVNASAKNASAGPRLKEYSCLEAIFCLGLPARQLVFGPVILQFQLPFLCLQIRDRRLGFKRLRFSTVKLFLRKNLQKNLQNIKTNDFRTDSLQLLHKYLNS